MRKSPKDFSVFDLFPEKRGPLVGKISIRDQKKGRFLPENLAFFEEFGGQKRGHF